MCPRTTIYKKLSLFTILSVSQLNSRATILEILFWCKRYSRTIGRNPSYAFSGVEWQGVDRCVHYDMIMSVHRVHRIVQPGTSRILKQVEMPINTCSLFAQVHGRGPSSCDIHRTLWTTTAHCTCWHIRASVVCASIAYAFHWTSRAVYT